MIILQLVGLFLLFSLLGFLFEYLIGAQTADNICGDSVMEFFNICAPLLTIYGLGMLLLIFLRYLLPDMNILLLTIIATMIITAFECGSGLLSLRYNGRKTWNYGNGSFCNGYIHPQVSAVWFLIIFIFYTIYDRL